MKNYTYSLKRSLIYSYGLKSILNRLQDQKDLVSSLFESLIEKIMFDLIEGKEEFAVQVRKSIILKTLLPTFFPYLKSANQKTNMIVEKLIAKMAEISNEKDMQKPKSQ